MPQINSREMESQSSSQNQGVFRTLQITLNRNGSGSDYGMGHADACGIRPGEILATGQIQYFFKTWDEYQLYAAGTQGPIAITVKDAAGNSYVFTFLNAALRNPEINANAKNTTIVATFDISGNPQAAGGTFKIDRIPATPPASGGK